MINIVSSELKRLAKGPEIDRRIVSSIMADLDSGSLNIVEAITLALTAASRHFERAYERDGEYVIEVSTRWPKYQVGQIEVCVRAPLFHGGYTCVLRHAGCTVTVYNGPHRWDFDDHELIRELVSLGKSDQFERLFEAAGFEWTGGSY